MKIKISRAYDITSLENFINKWVLDHSNIEIIKMSQSEILEDNRKYLTITIIYNEI
jgi:hypothetical protein